MIANKKYSGMEGRQNIDAEEDRAIDNSVPSVDDVIRAITGQSPRQSVDEIIGAVTELVEIELENRGLQGGVVGGRSIQPIHLRALGWAIMNATRDFHRFGLQLEADMRRLRNLPPGNRLGMT